ENAEVVAQLHRVRDACADPSVVDDGGVVVGPHPNADLRRRRKRTTSEHRSVVRDDVDDGAGGGFSLGARDGTREDPRMAAFEGALLPRFQHDSHEGRLTWSAVTDLAPGTKLSRFLLERQLGKGASGVVFLAKDTVLGQPVALKVLHPWLADDSEVRE